MKRLLHSMFAAGLALGLTACESEKPAPDKTAKADTKADAKAKAEPSADPPKADEPAGEQPAGDEPEDDTANPDDPAPEDADDDLAGYDPRVATAARIASQISAEPQKADDLLAAADLDRDKLDALMYEIANDPDLTAQYRMARGI